MIQTELMAEFMHEGLEDIAADIGLVGFLVVETLADADMVTVRIGHAIVLLAKFGADNLNLVRGAVERRVVDDFEFQGCDRRPHL
ncbi:hypothetical protein GGE67_006095 [Rhizobium leucaenae]|uniref:Uncharacterized protein n=1 Tax=Rhizobium lusitanum TaxID=293958 RepID=A0A1C3XH96_9HYPH|nr:hypothetical protein [Rhizobium leucaenae]MBB6305426.1 hypothetical protein [Rhizobium leucaenae]MBB6488538.1 hypothetical protein [Rhizobium lusitanum]SCB51641.1 hypothetical protein GA0061101_14136 [Rhizobium lusitanum]